MRSCHTCLLLLGLITLTSGYKKFTFDVTAATTHQFPFLAAIYSNVEDDIRLACTGTIVSTNFILTTARCVRDPVDHITIGNANADQGRRFEVKSTIIYPQYKPVFYPQGDIALIQLASPIDADTGVSRIRLPKTPQAGQNLTVAGFGFYITQTIKHTPYLHLPLNALLTSAHYAVLDPQFSNNYDINECEGGDNQTQICYGSVDQGVSHGLTGSPLFFSDGKGYHQIGIASNSRFLFAGKFTIYVTTYYTRISAYCDWLTEVSDGDVYCDNDEV